MAKLHAKKISDALKKAQRVGEVEESFTIAGCTIALRSLRTEEYELAMKASSEFEETQYINSFKLEHISRAIVEINGESLREYDFVEVEVEVTDPRTGSISTKLVSLERPKFVLDYVLATWSREAIDVAFRKFNEVVAKSEKAAVEGIEFSIPDETPEEKFRRLISEAKELEGQVPFELTVKILDEAGYIQKTSNAEIEKVDQALTQIAQDYPIEEPPEVPSDVVLPKLSDSLQVEPLKERVPLNRVVAPIPQPVQTSVVQPPSLTARYPSLYDLENSVISAPAATLRKAQELEQLEQLDTAPVQIGTRLPESIPEIPVLEHKAKLNPREVAPILDQPPVAGINARYKPPTRL